MNAESISHLPDDSQTPAVKLTPMFEQYFKIKKECPGALLFYRMGDFYELFYDDAKVAARELQIVLTSRNPGAEAQVPMCGVPWRSAETYISQLLEKGFHVAICEQMEDPKQVKGLVKRALTEIRTPSMAVEDANLNAKAHNYLGAFCWNSNTNTGAFAWLDYSTGEWSGLESSKEPDLWQWVLKLSPRELVVPDSFKIPKSLDLAGISALRQPERVAFQPVLAAERILKAQNVAELGAIGLSEKSELTKACGALLFYSSQIQLKELNHLKPFSPLNLNKHLILDEITERNLEIFRRLDGRKGPGTLWQVVDETLTPMGGRLLQERLRHPFRDLRNIELTADAVECFAQDDTLRQKVRAQLQQTYDIERLSTRIFLNKATPKDFIALSNSLAALPALRNVLEAAALPKEGYPTAPESRGDTLPALLQRVLKKWDDLSDYKNLLELALTNPPPLAITEGGLFKQGFNSKLDELIELTEHGENLINALLQKEQAQTPRLRLGYNKVFGYYFELSRSSSENVPSHFERKQTLANAERFTTQELKDLEEKLLTAADERKAMEYEMFQNLRLKVAEARPRLIYMAEVIAGVDYWQCLAEVARKRNWNRPVLHQGVAINIYGGRHPAVEAIQGEASFIPNDMHIDEARRLLIITGPNMSGKSTVLRQVAIICILAQMGSFVPAREARIGICDRIFSRVGASDNLAQGQSTFMVEMMETARILRQASKASLIILDEIGRGTSTFDGLSLAWAVVEDLVNRKDGPIRTLFATHYHELTVLEGKLPGVHNMNIAVTQHGGDIIFLRRLVPGPSDRSYGIEVARLAGVPQAVVRRAKIILQQLEAGSKNREARKTGEIGETGDLRQVLSQVSQPLLPCSQLLEQQEQEELAALQNSESETQAPQHPLFIVLQDLKPDNITPLEAINLITEWKKLWT